LVRSKKMSKKSASSENTNSGRSSESRENAHPIYVRDASPNEEPLNTYMIPSKYLSPAVNKRPGMEKRPLGNRSREPMKMYSQIATPMAHERVRRPRMNIPVEEISSRKDELFLRLRHYSAKVRPAVLAAIAFVVARSQAAGSFIQDKIGGLHVPRIGSRVKYSALYGAAVKRFGMPASWFRVAAPVAILLFLLGLGVFNGLFTNEQGSPATGGRGGSGDNAVIEVRDSANNGSDNGSTDGQAATPQNASDPSQSGAGSSGSAVQNGSTVPLGGGSAPVGGRGSGTTVAPAPSTSTGTVAPTQPAPTGGTGGTGGSGGSILPTTPTLPPPLVTPPSDCLCDTIDGVTQPVTNTLNTTTEGVTGTVDSTTDSLVPKL
jgi:hypothetical protein